MKSRNNESSLQELIHELSVWTLKKMIRISDELGKQS